MRSSWLNPVLIGNSGGIDGRELHQVFLLCGEPVVDGLHGVVGNLVVVALVADGGGKLRFSFEVLFPVIVKQGVQRPGAFFGRGGSGRGRRELRGEECGSEHNNAEEKRGESFQLDDSLVMNLGRGHRDECRAQGQLCVQQEPGGGAVRAGKENGRLAGGRALNG